MKRKLLFAIGAFLCSVATWAQTDVTSTYITNAGFDESGDFQTVDVATGNSNQRKAVTGWSHSGGDTYTTGAAIGFGTTGKINGANLPSENADGGTTGGALCLNAAWKSHVWYSQDVTLPAGNYTMTFKVNNVGQNAQFEKDPVMFSFTTTDGSSFSGNVHSYPVSTWTTQTITFALAAETTGSIKIGYKAGNTGSNNTPKLVVDYVKAMYNSNYTATLQSAIDRATILNARASDDDLAAAITTAQGVLDAADNTVAYQATINSAVTTLRSAISTAAAKVILLEGENITFMFENADFESGTPVTVGITTYDYDAATNGTHYSRMQVVEGWTIVANGNAKSAGIYQFGQNPFLGSVGNQYQAPASGSAVGEEKALGIVAVWSSPAQYKQDCTLPAGSYIIEVPVYNTAGTTAFSKNLIGFVENGGTEHLATAKTYATGSWTTEKIIFELANETAGYLSLGYTAANSGSGAMPHLFIDGVKVTYTSPIAAAYQRYQDALAAANTAIASGDYTNVTGSERTALQAAIDATPAQTKEAYNNAADALDAAREAFTDAKANYDALVAVNAMITAAGTLEYADAEKKPSASVTATSASDASDKVTSQTTALRAYYESNAKAEGVVGAVDYSSAVADANAETNTGWTNGVGIKNGDQPYTNSDGTTAAKYLDGGWKASAACDIDMTRTVEIPAGTYLLTVKARGAQDLTVYTLSIAGETLNLPHANGGSNGVFGNGWEDASIEFESDGTAQTLEVIAQSTANQQWFSMNDFRLVQLEFNSDAYANTPSDYNAMNAAIGVAEAKTLGFDEGEYAPYNNIEALTALATAKAINQTASNTNLKAELAALTTALSNWNVNAEEVNAVHNGNFATSQDLGWTFTGWGEFVSGLNSNTNASNGTARSSNPGTLTYGNKVGYTMPLDGNTVYRLTFKVSSWDNDNKNTGTGVSVLNGSSEGLATKDFAASGTNRDQYGAFKTYTTVFETGAAGDYTLVITAKGNRSVYTDIVLKKAVADVINISEEDAAAPSTSDYANVTLTRTLVGGQWNGFSLPFSLTAEQLAASALNGAMIKQFSSVADNVISTEDADAIVAGEPYLVKPAGNIENPSFEGVEVSNPAEAVKGEGAYTFQAHLYNTELATDGSVAYVSTTDSSIKKLTSDGIKGMRAIFNIPTSGSAKALLIDFGGADGILSVDAKGNVTENGTIYNLAGQRMSKAQKGVNIINGKKVLVK